MDPQGSLSPISSQRAPCKTQTICLRVVFKHSLSSSTSGLCPLRWGAVSCPPPYGAEHSFIPYLTPPNTAPCHSLGYCCCHQRVELSTAPASLREAVGSHEASPQPAQLWVEETKDLSHSSNALPSRPLPSFLAPL